MSFCLKTILNAIFNEFKLGFILQIKFKQHRKNKQTFLIHQSHLNHIGECNVKNCKFWRPSWMLFILNIL